MVGGLFDKTAPGGELHEGFCLKARLDDCRLESVLRARRNSPAEIIEETLAKPNL